jgi:hypothetical protein
MIMIIQDKGKMIYKIVLGNCSSIYIIFILFMLYILNIYKIHTREDAIQDKEMTMMMCEEKVELL